MIRKGSRHPRKIHKGSRKVHWMTKGDRTIYMSPEAVKAVTKQWLDDNAILKEVIEEDADGRWFELEIILPDTFDGNAVDGWVGVMVFGRPLIRVGLFWSGDLATWADSGWIDAPGKTPETLGDGRIKWFARYEVSALIRNGATIDHRMTCARYGKSITELKLFGSTLSLPNYPYAMPGDASQLETDLIAEGFTGATVSSTSGAWSALIGNYDVGADYGGNPVLFDAVWSGADITSLTERFDGSTVSLPNFPYTMPTDEALLESDLLAAGYDYPQVMLYKDPWEIFIPDLSTTGYERGFQMTITPADPIQIWTFFGTPNGTNPQTLILGVFENVRISGSGVEEAGRAFARMGITEFRVP